MFGFVHPQFGELFASEELLEALAPWIARLCRAIGLGVLEPRFSKTPGQSYWSQVPRGDRRGRTALLSWDRPGEVPASVLSVEALDDDW